MLRLRELEQLIKSFEEIRDDWLKNRQPSMTQATHLMSISAKLELLNTMKLGYFVEELEERDKKEKESS